MTSTQHPSTDDPLCGQTGPGMRGWSCTEPAGHGPVTPTDPWDPAVRYGHHDAEAMAFWDLLVGGRRSCPDDGTCHHGCQAACVRVLHRGPLSGVYPGDRWPLATKIAHAQMESGPAEAAHQVMDRDHILAALDAAGRSLGGALLAVTADLPQERHSRREADVLAVDLARRVHDAMEALAAAVTIRTRSIKLAVDADPDAGDVLITTPSDRPGWLGEGQPWPCSRCGTSCERGESHRCVPTAAGQ